MKKKAIRIIITIILCIITFIGGYYLTLFLDNLGRGDDLNVTVTFDDTESYIIPSTKKMTKEEALKEWPYIIHLENTSSGKGQYQIIIHDLDTATIKREDLNYLLMLDDKEVGSGKLSSIKENVLYTGEIKEKAKYEFKLYIWVINDIEEGKYEYKLDFNTIKSGGPGF